MHINVELLSQCDSGIPDLDLRCQDIIRIITERKDALTLINKTAL